MILVHFGTNDVTNGINTEEEMQKAIDHVQNESPETIIVLSFFVLARFLLEITINYKSS